MSNGCKDTNNEINYIEHIQSVLSIESSSRGGLAIFLTSPMGTTSTLLDLRERDKSMENFDNWPFTTVHMWGETPQGKWTLKIKNEADSSNQIFFF
jgi:subtilisin-like proprotein convertase family protein